MYKKKSKTDSMNIMVLAQNSFKTNQPMLPGRRIELQAAWTKAITDPHH
jgi:hypothetical protein